MAFVRGTGKRQGDEKGGEGGEKERRRVGARAERHTSERERDRDRDRDKRQATEKMTETEIETGTMAETETDGDIQNLEEIRERPSRAEVPSSSSSSSKPPAVPKEGNNESTAGIGWMPTAVAPVPAEWLSGSQEPFPRGS